MLLPALAFEPPAVQAPHSLPIPPKLTLDGALDLFRKRGLDLLIAETAVAQAQGDLRGSSALPAPQLNFTTGRSQGYQAALPGQSDRSYSASISENGAASDLLTGRRGLRMEVAAAALEAARMGKEDALRTLSAQVKIQFLQAALAKLNVELTSLTRDSAHRMLALVQKRLESGAVSEVDLARAEVAALETDQSLDTAIQTSAGARAMLAFLLGERGKPPEFEPLGTFEHPETPAALMEASPEKLLAEARGSRPDLRAAQAQVRKFEAALSLARREWVPDASWSLGVSQQGTGQDALQPRTWTLGLNLSLPSPRKVQGDTSRARADLQAQEFQRGKAQAQMALDVSTGWAMYSGARARLARMQDRILAQSKKASELVAFQYEKGAASLLDVLDAQRTWMAVKSEYLQNLNDYWTALFQLEQSLGKEISR